MSTKTDILQLVTDLEHTLGNANRIDREFDEVVEVLSLLGWWTEATQVSLTAGTGEYTLPTDHLDVLAVFYDGLQLSEETPESVEQFAGASWRDHVGPPLAYVRETLNDRRYRLYPIPGTPSKPFSFPLGSPFGVESPEYTAVVLCTIRKPTTFQAYYYLPAALRLCEREFARLGKHQDLAFSKICKDLGTLALEYLR